MNFIIKKDQEGDITFSGQITASELTNLKLDRFDRALIGLDYEESADFLLVLEMLFRRNAAQEKL